MKRLNQRQQAHLNAKFTGLCKQFLKEQYEAIVKVAIPTKPFSVRVNIYHDQYCGFAATKESIEATPQHKKLAQAKKQYEVVEKRVKELQAAFAERVLFSSNDFEEAFAVFNEFEKEIR